MINISKEAVDRLEKIINITLFDYIVFNNNNFYTSKSSYGAYIFCDINKCKIYSKVINNKYASFINQFNFINENNETIEFNIKQ